MHITSIGIDPGKTTSHLIALDDHGKVVIQSGKHWLSRKKAAPLGSRPK
jgi:hypothetical protein